MTVKELVALLQTFPQDLEIIRTRYSDYGYMKPREISIIKAVHIVGQPDHFHDEDWLMRFDKTMSAENKARAKDYLHFEGN